MGFKDAFRQSVPSFENFRQELERIEAEFNFKNPKFPFTSVGARSYVLIDNTTIALCQGFSWNVDHSLGEIRTIDSELPYDIYSKQQSVSASLAELIDPRDSAETRGLFATMASAKHQPIIDLAVFDKHGSRIFFAAGVFGNLGASISAGGTSVRNLSFRGMLYSHNVNQQFNPYPADGNSRLDKAKKALSNVKSALTKFGV